MSHLIARLGRHRENLKELHIGLSALASELGSDNPVRSKLAEASLQLGGCVNDLNPIAEELVELLPKEKTKTKVKKGTGEFPCRHSKCKNKKGFTTISNRNAHERVMHGGLYTKTKGGK